MRKLSQINEGALTDMFSRHLNGKKRKQDEIIQPEMVDLDLSVKWASFNLGAKSPEEYGDYFAWGETEGFSGDDESRSFDEDSYKANDYNEFVLDSEHDAATKILGGKWRMPTKTEWEELKDNTTATWEKFNGVKGRKYTSKKNGNWIFLPAAGGRFSSSLRNVDSLGRYWSSSLSESDPSYSWYFYFFSGGQNVYSYYRYLGFSVRPVLEIS